LLSFSWLCSLSSQAEYDVETHTIVDDGWAQIDLPFNFPFYGELFGTSFMFANGVVGFINPTAIAGTGIVDDGLCCNAFDFTQSNNNYGTHGAVRFNYLIAPWHTDLIDHPNSQGVFKTQGGCDTVDSCYQSYFWENISEYYDATDLNTFSTTIEPLGSIAFNYTQVDIQSHSVSVFISGDFSNSNEYEQWYYNHPSNGGVYWNSADSTPIEIPESLSICEIAPDASLACLYRPATWAGAYYDQQCGISALYDSGCDGYAIAYLAQQCAISVLYDSSCTGYASAYYAQQCGISGLYDTGCSNYETAYFDNQCVLDPLYSPACSGWYYVEEEPIDETVWEEEYGATDEDYEEIPVYETETNYSEVEIPSFDDLFDGSDTNVPTFETDYQETTTSFDAIVIAEVEAEIEMFFAEMDIEMPEIDMFDEPMEEEIDEPTIEPEQEETETDQGVTNEEDTETSEETSEEEPVDDEPELEPEEEIEEEIEEEPMEEEIDEEESEEQEAEEVEEEVEEEREEAEPVEKEVVMVAKVEPKKLTAKEKQKAREKKMREIITEKLKNLAIEIGEASSLKAQKELQAYIIALLNYNSGFSSYNLQLTDGNFYESRIIYPIRLPDSLRGRRIGLASELLHKQLVDIQWSEGYGTRQ